MLSRVLWLPAGVEDSNAWRIREARVVLGGAVAFTRLAPSASQAIEGQPWSEATLEAGLKALAADVERLSPSKGAAQAQLCECQLELNVTRLCACCADLRSVAAQVLARPGI